MMLPTFALSTSIVVLFGSSMVNAEIDLHIEDDNSIKNAAATIAYDMMTYYKGNQSGGIPGVLPGPPPDPSWGYYWWESGAMWGTLIDYWYYTGDSSYNDDAMAGIQWQTGANNDMMPANWSQSMGNDDQGFWGMTAMSAAETKFPDPPSDRPGWLALAQAVFNTQAWRIDNSSCGGGLRWQVYPYLTGYNYKNSIANGCFFNIGARLARYTNNETYAQFAEETWNWVTSVGYMDKNYNIFDGAHIEENCTDINKVQFSYNSGVYLLGAATMYNYTNGSAIWEERVKGLLNATFTNFFPTNKIAYEIACEAKLSCTTDMFSFKAFLTRWLAATTKMAPFTYDLIMPYLKASAVAAAKQCSGSSPFPGRTCGLSWSKGVAWDGTSGVGQQMAAMSAIFVNLVQQIQAPVTNSTGGTSVGNSAAGSGSTSSLDSVTPPTTGDRVGAGMVTTVVLVGMTGMFGWMSL
ncbi:glycoside hydrolase family 76 protein [Sclerotinia borealis F-4128]|uniref:Mannan endo-1,6-alpha-mannosidase n=1 Tax=Sclerotinia borealis (strain F-4128) TaxID=1432307 RepID=W9CDX9_SCLBF|nr:glycoside hydrolase family 76 protein [Sclerotinia borealis F-4128]